VCVCVCVYVCVCTCVCVYVHKLELLPEEASCIFLHLVVID